MRKRLSRTEFQVGKGRHILQNPVRWRLRILGVFECFKDFKLICASFSGLKMRLTDMFRGFAEKSENHTWYCTMNRASLEKGLDVFISLKLSYQYFFPKDFPEMNLWIMSNAHLGLS